MAKRASEDWSINLQVLNDLVINVVSSYRPNDIGKIIDDEKVGFLWLWVLFDRVVSFLGSFTRDWIASSSKVHL